MKRTIKRIQSLFLCLILIISSISGFVYADSQQEQTIDKKDGAYVLTAAGEIGNIIYMSSNGKDTNDGLTEETAVSSIETAAEKLQVTGGTIVILDDMTINLDKYEVTASAHRIYIPGTESTLYIRGVKKSDDTYTKLSFYSSSNMAPCLELGGPLTIYNLTMAVTSKGNIWMSANGHDLTIGENVNFELADGYEARFCSGKQNVTYSGAMKEDAPSTLNFYSGNIGEVYGGSFAQAHEVNGDVTINIMGGTFKSIFLQRSGANMNGNKVLNIYGGTVTNTIQSYDSTGTSTINIYNSAISKTDKYIGSFFKDGGAGIINELEGPVPVFEAPGYAVNGIPDEDASDESEEASIEVRNIIYMSSNGKDTNDGLTEETAVSSIEVAATKLQKTGGTIVILDDMTIDLDVYEVTASAHRIYIPGTETTLYIRGIKKSDNTYTKLSFHSSENKAPCLELGGPLAIYDLTMAVTSESNIWMSANGHTLTIGENVNFELASGFEARFCSGRQDFNNSGVMIADAPSTLNFFSGNIGEVYGGSFAKGHEVNGDVTINIMGGTFKSIFLQRDGANMNGNKVLNIYGGTVTHRIQSYESTGSSTINIYNSAIPKTGEHIGSFFQEGGQGIINELEGPVPTFEELSYVGSDISDETDTTSETKDDDDTSATATLKILSLNLRYATTASQNNQSIREPRIIKFVQDNMPDTIATQECEVFWRERLDLKLGELGYKRALKLHPNPQAAKNQIWYNPEVLTLEDSGIIWLSETPEIASKGFGSKYYISASWAIFKHNKTGEKYVQIDTHLDVDSEDTRMKESEVLMDFILKNFKEKGYSVVLTGDFNSREESIIYKFYSEHFTDARYAAKKTTDMNTFNYYDNDDSKVLDVSKYIRIDYVFLQGNINAESFEVFDKWGGGYMSDHNALMTTITIVKE